MKLIGIGFSFVIALISASPQDHRVRRYVGNNDWNWNGQMKSDQQTAWPTKGNAKINREGWGTTEGWSSGDVQQKDEDFVWNTQPQRNDKGNAHQPEEEGMGNLEVLLRGVPGMDFPDFVTVPDTAFDCASVPSQGYYGDMEAGCQVFHICQPGNRKDSFLCPLGTVFNQRHRVCDWWFNVNCSEAMSLYDLNKDIYMDVPAITTTEKPPQMPWSAQDLDRKRPPPVAKGWPQQPPGKQNNIPHKEVATKRGGKSDSSISTQAWSRSDVQQKEVTLSWTTAGSPSAVSSSKTFTVQPIWRKPTSDHHSTKPIWYGIDGQPAKDQSDATMRKRNGLAHPRDNAPFGTRMKSSSMATAGTWTPADVFQPTTSPRKSSVFHSSTTSQNWLSSENLPETSIVPTGVEGVWEQETTRKSGQDKSRSGQHTTVDQDIVRRTHQDTNPFVVGRRGIVTKSESFIHHQKEPLGDSSRSFGQRQTLHGGDPMNGSATSARAWRKFKQGEKLNVRRKPANSDFNSISRRKDWHP